MKKKVVMLKSMFVFFTVALFLFGVNIGSKAEGAENENCAKLEDLYLSNTVIINSCVVPAAGDLPEYCRVTGYVLPAIHFEVRLPTQSWNEKFYMAGCGGYCGSVMDRKGFTNAMNYGLLRNYAVATTDMGHWGKSMFDGTWAYNARQQEIDFGYRGTHEVTRVARRSSSPTTARVLFIPILQVAQMGGDRPSWRPRGTPKITMGLLLVHLPSTGPVCPA